MITIDYIISELSSAFPNRKFRVENRLSYIAIKVDDNEIRVMQKTLDEIQMGDSTWLNGIKNSIASLPEPKITSMPVAKIIVEPEKVEEPTETIHIYTKQMAKDFEVEEEE